MAVKTIRPIRVEGNVAYLTLTKGYEAVIDAADVPLVGGRNWQACVHKKTVYAQNNISRLHTGTARLLHRILMNPPSGMQVDHIDGNGLNNRRSNLRIVTNAENGRNRGESSNNTSGFKGVYWNKQRSKWEAQIRIDGKRRFLGQFAHPEDAHKAYTRAAQTIFGDFARTT